MTRRETSAEIDETAAQWALRIDDTALGDKEQAALDAWLEGDTPRLGAFVRAQAVLIHARRAKALGPDFDPASFNLDEADSGGAVSLAESEPEEDPAPGLWTRRRMLFGASAVAATGAFAFIMPSREASATIYETGRGESRLLPLQDGSTVTLNTQSKIAVTIDDTHRTIQLLHGEALFKVATAKRTPFIVQSGTTALRTQDATFAVCQLEAQPLEIKVCAGNVDVERGQTSQRLHANMQALLPPDGMLINSKVTAEDLQRDLAWQEGMLSFEDTPLAQAADEFARYSDKRIRIADPAVRAETVTGLYAANNPEGFARAAALSLNLDMQSTSAGILLTR